MFNLPPGPEIFVPNERARAALAKPLGEGLKLRPTGPSVRRDLIGATSVGGELVDAADTTHGWNAITLDLDTAVHVGHGEYAQIWRANVEVHGRICGKVVVKLFAEALWPLPHDFIMLWSPLEERVASELQAYASLRPTQGRDVPHCYGAYPFEMPWGDIVTGIVLEGRRAARRLLRARGGQPLHHRGGAQHDRRGLSPASPPPPLDVGSIIPRTDDIFVLRGSTVWTPRFVFVGFSWSRSAKQSRREVAVEDPDLVYRWLDECYLQRVWSPLIDEDLYCLWPSYSQQVEPGLAAWEGERGPWLVDEETPEERAVHSG